MSKNISFATFNLYNLQVADGPRRTAKPYTAEEYGAKVKWSAEKLRAMNADVVAFQELWSAQCLRDVLEEAGLQQAYAPHFIHDTWRDIAVAAAVRKPWSVRTKQVHKAFPDECILRKRRAAADESGEDDEVEVGIDRFSRSVLELEVAHEQEPDLPVVHVYCAHLKSKLPTRLDREETQRDEVKRHSQALGAAISTIRRTAEAAALRVLLAERMKGTSVPTVLLGDLNDGVLSNTVSILTAQPRFRLSASSRAGSSSDAGLYSTQLLQQVHSFRDVYFSHVYNGVPEVLDHILVSEQFYDHSKNRVWAFDELRSWNDHLAEESGPATDHGLAAAYFTYKPAKSSGT